MCKLISWFWEPSQRRCLCHGLDRLLLAPVGCGQEQSQMHFSDDVRCGDVASISSKW